MAGDEPRVERAGFLWWIVGPDGARLAGPYGTRAAAEADLTAHRPAEPAPEPAPEPDRGGAGPMSELDHLELTPAIRRIAGRVLPLIRQGMRQAAIAAQLECKPSTVHWCVLELRKKGVLPPAPPRKRRDALTPRPSRAGQDAKPGARGRRARPCIRCGDPFMSEGPHNRMCKHCRGFAAGLGAEFL